MPEPVPTCYSHPSEAEAIISAARMGTERKQLESSLRYLTFDAAGAPKVFDFTGDPYRFLDGSHPIACQGEFRCNPSQHAATLASFGRLRDAMGQLCPYPDPHQIGYPYPISQPARHRDTRSAAAPAPAPRPQTAPTLDI